MIPLFKVFMNPEAKDRVAKVLDSGFIGQGPVVDEFEAALKEFFNWPYLATVNAATSGLHLAVHMMKHVDHYRCSPLTCTASNMPILANGKTIEWGDVNPETLNMHDFEHISPDTGIMYPLWGGNTLDVPHAESNQMIIDAAHGLGANMHNLMIWHNARFVVVSLQAIKHMTSGDGGVMLFRDENDMERAKLLRWYGIDRCQKSKDFRCEADIPEFGFKFHMNDINAAIGLANLKSAWEVVGRFKRNARTYSQHLANVPGVQTLRHSDDCSHWIYSLLVEDRDGFRRKMTDAGIMVSQVHKRNDGHTTFIDALRRDKLKNMDWIDERYISIPNGWWVTDDDVAHIIKTIQEGW